MFREGRKITWIVRELLCFFGDDLCDETWVEYVITRSNEWLNQFYYLYIVQIVEKTISAYYKYVVVLDSVNLLVGLCWVVSARSNLPREVEAMSLFLCSEDCNEVKTRLPEKQVSRVTKVCSVDNRCLFVKRCQNACTASNFIVLIDSIDKQLCGVHHVLVFHVFGCELIDQRAKSTRVVGGIDTALSPATNSIGKCDEVVSDSCCVFTSFGLLRCMRIDKDASMESIHSDARGVLLGCCRECTAIE